MERRPLFVAGDVTASVLVGLLSALGAHALVAPGWNMWLAMLVGMGIGTGVAGVLGTVFQIRCGALEVVIPVMLSGMLAGMIAAMLAGTAPRPTGEVTLLGGGIGFVCVAFVYGMDAYLTREGHSWTP